MVESESLDPFALDVQRDPIPLQVARRILRSIVSGELKPGQRLPTERELASSLGVARPTVREALRALQMMKVVTVRQGGYTQVASLSADSLIEPFEWMCQTAAFDLNALFEVRLTLEVGIARAAAERITEEELAGLDACMERAENSLNEPISFLEADMDLHERILSAARNPLFSALMTAIRRLGRQSRERTAQLSQIRTATLLEHRKIIDALHKHDQNLASEAMFEHISNVAAEYRKEIEKSVKGKNNE